MKYSTKQLGKGLYNILYKIKRDNSIYNKELKDSERIALKWLENRNLGYTENNKTTFNSIDKLKIGTEAIKNGIEIKEVAKIYSWQDFEKFSAYILEKNNYSTINNFRTLNPRTEIDVIGMKLEKSIIIDCKHWAYTTESKLNNPVKKQIKRVQVLSKKDFWSNNNISEIIPIIVTLHNEKIINIDNVPIVPIEQLNNFIINLDEFREIFTIYIN